MSKTARKLLGTLTAFFVAAVLALTVIGFTACGGDDTPDVPATTTYTVSITGSDVSNGAVALKTGSTTTLTATVYADGEADSSLLSDVDWSTSASDVATVSGGTVTAVKAGSATITASYGTATASVAVTVTDISYTISLTGDDIVDNTITLLPDETSTVSAVISADGAATSNTVTWSSSNTDVATVSGGVITAVKAGTATITASGNGASASVSVVVNAANSVELVGTGTMMDMDATVYLDLNFDDNTAKLYEVINLYNILFYTVISPSEDDVYPGSSAMQGAYMAIGEGTISANTDEESGDITSYSVAFYYGYITFTVTIDSNGAYNCYLTPLVAFGLLDAPTATGTVAAETEDDAEADTTAVLDEVADDTESEDEAEEDAFETTVELYANTTMSGTEVDVYLQLDLDSMSAKLYEVMIINRSWGSYGTYTIISPSSDDIYTGTGSGYTMNMAIAVGTGTVTANYGTDDETGETTEEIASYTVSFSVYGSSLDFTVTFATDDEGNTVYSTSLAPLASWGLIDGPLATTFVPNTAELVGTGTMGGSDATVYIDLDFDEMTAKLYETMSVYTIEFTIVSPSADDIIEGSSTIEGAYMAIGTGTITAVTDEETGEVTSYTVTFSIYGTELALAVTMNEDGTYSCSLAPLVTWGLLDAPEASYTEYFDTESGNEDETVVADVEETENEDEAEAELTFEAATVELTAEGTMSGMAANVYLQLDLDNMSAKLYETVNMYLDWTIVSPDSTDTYGSSSAMDGMHYATGLGTVTAVYAEDEDGNLTEELTGYTVVFNFTIYYVIPVTLTFNVTVADATEFNWSSITSDVVGITYSCPLTDLVIYGLLDAPVATNAVTEDDAADEEVAEEGTGSTDAGDNTEQLAA